MTRRTRRRGLAARAGALAAVALAALASPAAMAALDAEVGICPWNGPGTLQAGHPCEDPDGCSLEIYDADVEAGWAKVRCTGGAAFCEDPMACTGSVGDGLTYLAFVTQEAGGLIRYNDLWPYEAVLVVHIGGGGLAFVDEPRDVAGSSIDYQDLQDNHGFRVVGVQWAYPLIDYPQGIGIEAGWFTRAGPEGTTLQALSRRPAALLDKIYVLLNPDGMPFGAAGSSGGAHVSVTPVAVWPEESLVAERIDYLGLVSGSPFWNLQNQCNETTPPDTFVDADDGSLGPAGAAATMQPGGKTFIDGILGTGSDCDVGTMGPTPESNLEDLIPPGASYRGTVHAYVATGTVDGYNDSDGGITWSLGNLFNHSVFDDATKIWDRCTTQGHGSQLRDPTSPCFERIYEEAKLALTPVRTPVCLLAGPDSLLRVFPDPAAGCPQPPPSSEREFIFGSVANLSLDAGAVGLGNVQCVGPTRSTLGRVIESDDADLDAGEVRFYLWRRVGAANFGPAWIDDTRLPRVESEPVFCQ